MPVSGLQTAVVLLCSHGSIMSDGHEQGCWRHRHNDLNGEVIELLAEETMIVSEMSYSDNFGRNMNRTLAIYTGPRCSSSCDNEDFNDSTLSHLLYPT